MPVANDINSAELAEITATGAEVRNAIVHAAADSWVRDESAQFVTHNDLRRALQRESATANGQAPIGFGLPNTLDGARCTSMKQPS